MMKNIKILFKAVIALLIFNACTENERDLAFLTSIKAPSNLAIAYDITQDNTGLVTLHPTADGAAQFEVFFGDGTDESEKLANGNSVQRTYTEGNFSVKVVASNTAGDAVELTQPLVVSFKAPENLVVVVENDLSISKQVNVTATADFATMFDFYSGETGADPISGNIGETISFTYQNPGTYEVKVVAKGAAIQTTEYTASFEVTEILAPTEAAPKPPGRAETDVISIFSDVYTDVTLNELPTEWSSTGFEATTVGTDNVWKLTALDFLGIVTNYDTGIDVSSMEKLHIDYWVPEGTANGLAVKIVNTVDSGEAEVSLGATVGGTWQSIDLDMTAFDAGNLANKEKITQILLDSKDGNASVVYIDNFYFYKAPTSFPKIYDDFEGNGTIAEWVGDSAGMDNNFANPFSNADNNSSTVLKYEDTGGQYANIRFDVPQNFDFSVKKSFTLKVYVPSSSITGSSPNQISLKLQDGTVAEPWASQTEIVKPIQLDQWQTLTFDFENDVTAGAANPLNRSDFNRVVLQLNSENNNDNVTAYIDDFEWGSDLFVGPIPSDNFEGAGNINDWFGDSAGVTPGFANPYINADNNSAKVLEYDDTGGQYANIRFNVEPNFNMERHTFSFKIYVASSDVSGTAPNQVALKLQDGTIGEPWSSQSEIVKTIQLDTWQTVMFDFKNDAIGGAANPLDRTDFNRVVIQVNGENNNDPVKAYIDDVKYQ